MTDEREQYLNYYCTSKKCDERNGRECDNCMYEKGRADAINEILDAIRELQSNSMPVKEMLGICKVGEIVEQLKEQK